MAKRARRWFGPEARLLAIVMGETDAAWAMQQKAWQLLDDAELTKPPFSMSRAGSFQGVRTIRTAPMRGDARLIPEHGQLVIEVNETHTRGKQRFSAAHEIAHTLLPGYRQQAISDEKTGAYEPASEEEALCDVGAATLLLDPRRLREHAALATLSLATFIRLAELFDASLQATAAQLAAIDAWPCAFVFWEEGFRKDERPLPGSIQLPGMDSYGSPTPKLRVKVTYPAPSFPYFIPRNKSAAEASTVSRCRDYDGSLRAAEDFAFGRTPLRLTCESQYAPYMRGDELRPRVISLLLPPEQPLARDTAQLPLERM